MVLGIGGMILDDVVQCPSVIHPRDRDSFIHLHSYFGRAKKKSRRYFPFVVMETVTYVRVRMLAFLVSNNIMVSCMMTCCLLPCVHGNVLCSTTMIQ